MNNCFILEWLGETNDDNDKISKKKSLKFYIKIFGGENRKKKNEELVKYTYNDDDEEDFDKINQKNNYETSTKCFGRLYIYIYII